MKPNKKQTRTAQLEQLVTPEDLETRWGILKATQAAMRSRGELPFVLVGRRMPRYRMGELTTWLDSRDRRGEGQS